MPFAARTMLVLLLILPPLALAEPAAPLATGANRPGLIAAFAQALARTARVEPLGPERWRIASDELGYQGELAIETVLIRAQPKPSPYSHLGVIDFRLADLPPERAGSLALQFWKQPLQTFYYRRSGGGWTSSTALGTDPMDGAGPDLPGLPWWSGLFSWGLPLAFVLFLVSVFIALARQLTRTRKLIGSSDDINAMARENIERARALQTEQAALMRRSQELGEDNNRLLREILAALKERQ